MAKKKENTNEKTLTNGALSLIILFCVLIGLLCGWLIAYLTL